MMLLPWIQVSFECYDDIQIPYTEKTFLCLYDRIDVRDVGM